MRTYAKLAITALIATAALAALVGSASATRLSITNRNIRAVWSSMEFSNSASTLRCRVTLEGTFHENTIAKVARSLIGYITRAEIRRPCTGGTVWLYNGVETNEVLTGTLPNSLPWHITYEGFNGELPTPTAIRILLILTRFKLRATFLGITLLCVYRTTSTQNATGTANLGAGGRVTNIEGSSAELTSESGGGCPRGRLRSPAGDGILTLLGTSNAVSVTLI